jgi:anion-transporting  ArsA/GET3 family ATPase
MPQCDPWSQSGGRGKFVKEILKQGATLLVLGTGGVGKTTIAAALGMAAAIAGLDTGVLTIDPARRLRDALGIERLSSRPVRLEARRLRAAGLDPALKLSAMVLDVKRTWDGLVERFVETPEARRRILENPFYRSLTEQFAGAEAYAALDQLYGLQGRFDARIVDTPPAPHAFEFVETPTHLVRLFDSSAVRWLFLPYTSASKRTIGLAGRAARMVLTQLENFAGVRMLISMSEFLAAAAQASAGIADQFLKTARLLRSANVHFILVTTPEEDRLSEARTMADQMKAANLGLRAVVLNRIVDDRTFNALRTTPGEAPAYLAEIAALNNALAHEKPRDCRLGALANYLEDYSANQRAALERGRRFARHLPAEVKLVVAPEIETGMRDLRTLAKLASILIDGAPGRRFLEDAGTALSLPKPIRRAAR